MTITDSGSARQDQLNRKLLRVLIVENSPDDAELVEREISKAGYELASVRVQDWGAFREALATRDWDVIIADYTIPGFGAVPALELLKQSNRDIPFIIVSGAISDETAVKSMRAGAHDYVLKNNLVRLVPAIEREVREVVTRQNKSQADTAVRYLSAIVESSDDAIIGKTLDGTITSWNRGAERLYGYAAAEVLGRSISILMPPRCSDELTLILQRVARGERIEQNDVARRRKDGTLVDVSLRISPILDKAGNIVGASTIARNITERKRAEEQIRHLASFPELNPNPVIETDLEGNLIYANPVARQQYGGLLQPKGQEPVFENWRSIIVALEAGGPHSMAREVKIGEAFFHQTIHYLPERNLVRFYFADITERKQQEEQSRRNEKEARARAIELAAVLDAVPAITFTAYDPECLEMTGNRTAYDLLRLPLGAIVSKSVPSQGRPSNFQFVQEGRELAPEELPVQLAARNGREVRNFEFSVVFEDGTSRDLFGHAVPLLDEAGLPRGAVGAFVDITERKRAEEELRESEKRYRTLFESIDEGFCVVELLFDEHGTANDMRYLEMNPASSRHGIPAEVVGKTAREVLPNLEPCWFEMFGKVALTGESIRYVEHSEALNRWYEGNAFRIGEPEQHKVAILFQDISDKKRAEQALHESEARVRTKLESIVSPEGDVGNLELADIIDVPALQALFEDSTPWRTCRQP